jgi:hypothetical protein
LTSEVWQFLMVALGFFVVAMCWLFVVYLPGRTLEQWENQDSGRGDGKAAPLADPGNSEGPLNPGS